MKFAVLGGMRPGEIFALRRGYVTTTYADVTQRVQVLRRTHSSLMREKNVDPKVVADQLGHTLDVNLNVYTQTSLERKIEAVETLESSLVN